VGHDTRNDREAVLPEITQVQGDESLTERFEGWAELQRRDPTQTVKVRRRCSSPGGKREST
jgi:hypothetical protein